MATKFLKNCQNATEMVLEDDLTIEKALKMAVDSCRMSGNGQETGKMVTKLKKMGQNGEDVMKWSQNRCEISQNMGTTLRNRQKLDKMAQQYLISWIFMHVSLFICNEMVWHWLGRGYEFIHVFV